MAVSFNDPTPSLPVPSEGDLEAMNQLMADKRYRIKASSGFLRADRTDRVLREFILYTLNDYLGHVQRCVAYTRKMLPLDDVAGFAGSLARAEPVAAGVVNLTASLDIRTLGSLLGKLQATQEDVTVRDLVPFVKLLFRTLIRVYYLGTHGVSRVYRAVHGHVVRELVPQDPEALREYTTSAIGEWQYLIEHVVPALYPLVLRMTSAKMLSFSQLFYANGSKVLAWLDVSPEEVYFLKDGDLAESPHSMESQQQNDVPDYDPEDDVSDEVKEGLAVLETLFPEAGWDRLETMPDLCPYFQGVLQFQDGFTQLAPENPLQQTLVLFWILEELFQGLRLIKFEPLPVLSAKDDVEDIDRILDEWILYQESVFDKTFSVELKAYTHQIYTQPDFYKTPYGRKLLSNMYTLIKTVFLPYFDIRMYGTTRGPKDDRLPPFYTRVARLKRLLVRYNEAIETGGAGKEQDPDSSVPGVVNPWSPYKFDIANPLSKRLDAICGGKTSRMRTNALLIRYTLSVLNVLDWWINDKQSYAYRETPDYLYRVIEPGSSIPAFGVKAKPDIDALFLKHLKARSSPFGTE